jgi:CHASE3 domain sensor protein
MKLPLLSMIFVRGVVPAVLVPLLACPSGLLAQAAADDHLVSSEALQHQVQLSSAERAQQIANVTTFLSTPIAERAMRDSKIDPIQIRTAIPTLSDQELKDLASRAADAQKKIAGGGLTSLALTLIVLGVVIIILVAIFH